MTIDLQKRKQNALISLTKGLEKAATQGIDLGDVSAQVKLVIDRSGSMEFSQNQFYTRGEIQELSERVLGLSASGLDDDGNVQVYPFHTYAMDSFTVDTANYSGVLQDWVDQNPQMLRTDYVAVINRLINESRDSGDLDPGKPPVLVVFQTDGAPDDKAATKRALKAAASLPIFWVFVGLGRDTSFLGILDDLPGRVIDNVSAFGTASILGQDDSVFYDKITGEFLTKWLPEARRLGIVKDQ